MIYIGSYQFMAYMATAKYSETGQLLDSGVDLNMEGGIAEYVLLLLYSRTYNNNNDIGWLCQCFIILGM